MGTWWDHCSRDDRIRSPSASEWLIVVGLYVMFPSTVYTCISAVHIYSSDLYRVAASNLRFEHQGAPGRTHESYLGNDQQHSTFPLTGSWDSSVKGNVPCWFRIHFYTCQMIRLSVTWAKKDKLSPFWMTQVVYGSTWQDVDICSVIGTRYIVFKARQLLYLVFFLKCNKRISAALKWQQLKTRVLSSPVSIATGQLLATSLLWLRIWVSKSLHNAQTWLLRKTIVSSQDAQFVEAFFIWYQYLIDELLRKHYLISAQIITELTSCVNRLYYI